MFMPTILEKFVSFSAENPPVPGVRINGNVIRKNEIKPTDKQGHHSSSSEETASSEEDRDTIHIRNEVTAPSFPQQSEHSTNSFLSITAAVSTIVSTTVAPLATTLISQVTDSISNVDSTTFLAKGNLTAQDMASDASADESTGWTIVAGVTGVVALGSLVAGGAWCYSRLNKVVERYHEAIAYSANDPKGT
jgi:hypothetical protein